jgi:hypothetical protein
MLEAPETQGTDGEMAWRDGMLGSRRMSGRHLDRVILR